MRPLHLDYRRRAPLLAPAEMFSLATASVLLILVVAYGVSLQQQLARLDSTAAHARMPTARDPHLIAVQTREARATAARLTLAWDALFAAIEHATAARPVALLAVQPDPAAREVRLSGEAKNLEEVLGYVEALAGSKALGRVHLTEHEILDEPERPVRFVVIASWQP